MPPHLLFDLDGVVVDSELARDGVMRDFLASFGKAYDRDRTKPKLAGKHDLEVAAVIKEEYGLPGTPQEIKAARTETIRRLYADTVPFVPGFLGFYKGLRTAFPSARVAAASGMDAQYYDLVDARLGLTMLFDGNVFLSHRLGARSKPAPDIFLRAAEGIGVEPGSCIVFEDAPGGIAAANAAGMRAVALTRTFTREILDAESARLLERSPDVLYVDSFDPVAFSTVIEFIGC